MRLQPSLYYALKNLDSCFELRAAGRGSKPRGLGTLCDKFTYSSHRVQVAVTVDTIDMCTLSRCSTGFEMKSVKSRRWFALAAR